MTAVDADRFLVLAPRGRDAELMATSLTKDGIRATPVVDADALLAGFALPTAGAIITQEALTPALREQLRLWLSSQPPWSDLPVILLVNAQHSDALRAIVTELGNVTVLERPLTPETLGTAARAALRARQRQYEARTAIQQRDQFLAMLGHELRNPLAAIVLAAKLAREGRDRNQLDSRLDIIERQSNLLARLVDDLLDVARVTTGKVRLRREAVDIDEAVRGCLASLQETATRRSIQLVFAATSGAIIEADLVRVEQVLGNLVSNAIKYSPAGRSVRVSTAVDGDTCVIRVRDHGIGIAPEMQPRVFDLFAQVDGSLERAVGGMGIGLTLVDRLVRLHGGTVEVVSAGLGHGSEFVVRLPIGHPATPPNVVRLEPRANADKVRVVLVEDNIDLRDLTAEMLKDLGCVVSVASDGAEGVASILEARPELALVDLGLPVLDGYEVARRVRATFGPGQLLVAVSGYGLEQDRDDAHRAGFDLHMTKPLDYEGLRSLVERARSGRAVASG